MVSVNYPQSTASKKCRYTGKCHHVHKFSNRSACVHTFLQLVGSFCECFCKIYDLVFACLPLVETIIAAVRYLFWNWEAVCKFYIRLNFLPLKFVCDVISVVLRSFFCAVACVSANKLS